MEPDQRRTEVCGLGATVGNCTTVLHGQILCAIFLPPLMVWSKKGQIATWSLSVFPPFLFPAGLRFTPSPPQQCFIFTSQLKMLVYYQKKKKSLDSPLQTRHCQHFPTAAGLNCYTSELMHLNIYYCTASDVIFQCYGHHKQNAIHLHCVSTQQLENFHLTSI